MYNDEALFHHGVKGMKWKHHKKIGWDEFKKRYNKSSENEHPVLSKENYDKLSTSNSSVIKKGDSLSRISGDPEINKRSNSDKMYVVRNKNDIKRYQSHLPDADIERQLMDEGVVGYIPSVYNVKYKVLKDLITPSDKEQVDIFIKTLSDDPDRKYAKNLFDFNQRSWMNDNHEVGGIAKKDRDLIDTMDKEELGRRLYYTFMKSTTYSQAPKIKDLNNAYYSEIIKKGYNAVHDDNDRGRLSDDPLLILDSHNLLSRASARKISEKQREKDKQNVMELINRI